MTGSIRPSLVCISMCGTQESDASSHLTSTQAVALQLDAGPSCISFDTILPVVQ